MKTLEKVFKSVGEEASGEKCDVIEGLIKEIRGLMKEASGDGKNAALIGACQAVEHYEIARYGTLREWAKVLGHDEAHDLLTGILDQEKGRQQQADQSGGVGKSIDGAARRRCAIAEGQQGDRKRPANWRAVLFVHSAVRLRP